MNVGPTQTKKQKDGNMLRIFEGRILTVIYGPIEDNGIWRRRYSNELCVIIYLLSAAWLTPGGSSTVHKHTLYDEQDVGKVIKIGRLGWLRHIFRMQGLNPCRKLTVLKPEGTRRVGKPNLWWLESVEEPET
jgi:hypothetical protein